MKWAQVDIVSVRNAMRKFPTDKVYLVRMSDVLIVAEKCCVKAHITMNFSKKNTKRRRRNV